LSLLDNGYELINSFLSSEQLDAFNLELGSVQLNYRNRLAASGMLKLNISPLARSRRLVMF